jgi:class 3 adenylate cyclase
VLNRAARIMSAGHGGQVLLSSATAGLVGAVGLLDLGEHRLKDLGEPEQIFQVATAGAGFPPLRTLSAVRSRLSPITSRTSPG